MKRLLLAFCLISCGNVPASVDAGADVAQCLPPIACDPKDGDACIVDGDCAQSAMCLAARCNPTHHTCEIRTANEGATCAVSHKCVSGACCAQ